MDDDIILIKNLQKSFGNKEILKGVNLSIPRNSIFALLGHNGAGKTTLIRIILGLLNADNGTINIDCYKNTKYNDIGVVFDLPSLFDGLSALDNLDFFAEIDSIDKKDRKKIIQRELEQANLWSRRNEKVKGWSTGMKQRLAIIRASLIDHDILILDEPSSGLDPEVLTWLYEKMLKFKQRGGTILFTTHNFEDVESISDHAAILQEGLVLASGKTSELLIDNQSKIFELSVIPNNKSSEVMAMLKDIYNNELQISINGMGNIEITWKNNNQSIYPVINILRDNGVEIEEFKVKKHSLREVYLSYTRGEAF